MTHACTCVQDLGPWKGPAITVDATDLSDYVGQPPFTSDRIYGRTPVGVVMGLAWTSMGGNALYIEAAMVESGEGKGGIRTTGARRVRASADVSFPPLQLCRQMLHYQTPLLCCMLCCAQAT
jgi:ATP-dependent Lon protease